MLFACLQAPKRSAFLETKAPQLGTCTTEALETRLDSLHRDIIHHANNIIANEPVIDQQIKAKIKLLNSMARHPDAPPGARKLSQRAMEHHHYAHAYRRTQQMLERQLQPALANGRFPRGGVARLKELHQELIRETPHELKAQLQQSFQPRARNLEKAAIIGSTKARIKSEARKISHEQFLLKESFRNVDPRYLSLPYPTGDLDSLKSDVEAIYE